MILAIWLVAFLVCIAPLLGWKDAQWAERLRLKQCLVSQDLSYQIFASASSFYLPLLVILLLYWRIFQTARKRIRRRRLAPPASLRPPAGGVAGGLAAALVTAIGRPLPTVSEATTTTAFTASPANSSPDHSVANGLEAPPHPARRKPQLDAKRERKAAKTLAIITGAFVLCWLPFFVMAVLMPIDAHFFDKPTVSLFLWLGYFNSTLNPIIYTIFSPEFRHAFQKILCGRKYARRSRQFAGGLT